MKYDPVDIIGTTDRVIAPNVWEFIFKAADIYGRMKAQEFSQRQQALILEGNSQSPIEDLFWIAFEVMCDRFVEEINAEHGMGIWASSQHPIGPYRVDFFLKRHYASIRQPGELILDAAVIVELDGHEFHDKDKHQRSYEKKRDRYFVSQGYRVVHFTGSDVAADPFRVAHEVLELLHVAYEPYDPSNPLGIE